MPASTSPPRSNGHDFGCVMHFVDEAAFLAYLPSPAHQQLLSWLVPLVEATDVDFIV